MSVRALSLVWEQSRAEGTELVVMLALADWADDFGFCFPSYSTIAKRARISERQAMRIVKKFVDAGELERSVKGHLTAGPGHRGGRTGLQPRNLYRLSCMPQESQRGDMRVTTSKQRGVARVTTSDVEEVTPMTSEEVTSSVLFPFASLNDPSVQDPSVIPKASTASTTPLPSVQLIADHRTLYQQHFNGRDPKCPGPAEYKQSKVLVERYGGYDRARELLVGFFDSRDRFLHDCDHEFLTFVKFAGKVQVELARRTQPRRSQSRDANSARKEIRDANVSHVAQEEFSIIGMEGK